MSDTPSFTKKPNRQYYQKRPGVTMRVKIPMKPAIPCVIYDNMEGGNVIYDFDKKKNMGVSTAFTKFPSHTQAKRALWHLCQDLRIPHRYKLMQVKV